MLFLDVLYLVLDVFSNMYSFNAMVERRPLAFAFFAISWPCTSLPAKVGQGGSDLDPKFHEHKVIHIPWQAGEDSEAFNILTR